MVKIPFEIREAQPADARAIADLLASAFEAFKPEYTPAAYSATVLTPPFLDAAIRLYRACGFEERADGGRDLFGTPLIPMRKRL